MDDHIPISTLESTQKPSYTKTSIHPSPIIHLSLTYSYLPNSNKYFIRQLPSISYAQSPVYWVSLLFKPPMHFLIVLFASTLSA